MAVGDDALRSSVMAIVFENPEAVKKRPQARRWPGFGISNHVGMIPRNLIPVPVRVSFIA
jgi:hypothetical protein